MEPVEEHHVKDMFEILSVVVLTRYRILLATLGASTWRVLRPRGPLACRLVLRPVCRKISYRLLPPLAQNRRSILGGPSPQPYSQRRCADYDPGSRDSDCESQSMAILS